MLLISMILKFKSSYLMSSSLVRGSTIPHSLLLNLLGGGGSRK